MSKSGRLHTVSLLGALLVLVAVIAVAVAMPDASRAGGPRGSGAVGRLVLSPRPGQVVRSNAALVRVRSGKGDKILGARLNGRKIGGAFGRPRRGVRSLRASLSYGLRRGRNVLRVSVRPRGGAVRTSTVTFIVRRDAGLVGAGRDGVLDVGRTVEMQGTSVPGVGADCAGLRWSVAQTPPAAGSPVAGTAGPRRVTLTSPDGRSVGFDPRVPGIYVLRLTAGVGACATSDLVKVKVLERSRLVPLETMAAAGGGGRGIRVGRTTYRLKEAEGAGSFAQLLVLDRGTLEFVADKKFDHAGPLQSYLASLQPGVDLAILALQPEAGGPVDFLGPALKLIGGPDAMVPSGPGSASLIGVPGMKPDEAKWNFTAGGKQLAAMNGYLTPDQWGNYGFASSTRVPFDFGPQEACEDCGTEVAGFRLHHLDPRTGAPAAHDGQIYKTGGAISYAQAEAEVGRLAADLDAIPSGDVVMLESFSDKHGTVYDPPVAKMPSKIVAGLAAAVAKVGGTRNGFNRIVLKGGAPGSRGLTYALVGWGDAGEGAGAEAAADVEGEGDAPELSGVLRPNHESLLRPEEGDSSPDALTELVMRKPTEKWPLEGEPAPMRAFAWLGEQNEKLGADPRADYASQPFTKADWNGIASQIEKVEYSQVPAGKRQFTKKDFLEAREELVKELRWVGSVRSYLESLAKPISDSEILSYAKVRGIAAKIYKEAQEPKDEATMRWLEFTQILLELGGPFTHEVSGTVASAMSLGIWLFGSNEEGGEADEISFKADELGDEIVHQMHSTVETYKRMGDVIVTDPAKLEFVGEHGGCSPSSKGCPPGWSFDDEDITILKSDLQRTVEREAWQELLPLGFKVFGTNHQRLADPPDLRSYNCGGIHPFSEFSPTQEKLLVYPLLWEVDTTFGTENDWRSLVLAKPRGNHFHASTLADETAERVFGPVSASKSPDEGGLGVSLARLVPEKEWQFWSPTPPAFPSHDACE